MSRGACRKRHQWENCYAQVLEQGHATCWRKWYVFWGAAPRMLPGPGRGRMLGHEKPNDRTSGASHCDFCSVRCTKIRGAQQQSTTWWKTCIRPKQKHDPRTHKGCVSNSWVFPPPKHSHTSLSLSVRISCRRRKMSQHGLHMGQLGYFWWKPKADSGCVATTHTRKIVEKENLSAWAASVWKEMWPSNSGLWKWCQALIWRLYENMNVIKKNYPPKGVANS